MEGAIYEFGSAAGFVSLAGFVLLVLSVAGIFFGYMAEEEKAGRRLYWAEWPLPGAEETLPDNVVRLRAAA